MSDYLYDQIDDLEEAEWNYYFGNPANISLEKPFVTNNPGKEFISQYFKKGGKDKITDAFDLSSFQDERADHTVAVFFLGALLFKHTKFKELAFFDGDVDKWYDFKLFMWFVICLAHDAAYYREEDPDLLKRVSSVKELYTELSIEYKLFDREIRGVPKSLLACTKDYFVFRHAAGRTDHGIYAGVQALDALVKNRIEKRSQVSNDLLYWAEDLDPYYAMAAGTIAVHNMWFPKTEKVIEQYREAGLDLLINYGPITFRMGPWLYFLGLIDTIDPIKAYRETPVLEVLKKVQVDYTPTSFTITVSGDLKPDILLRKAEAAKEWLDIHFTSAKNGVTICLHLD